MLLLNFVRVYKVVMVNSTPTSHHHLFHFLQNSSFRLVSTISNSSFTVDYLVNSCGLSPESALKASKSIELTTPTRPDSVLSLFKTFDISQPHISKLISLRPKVLLADPDETLKPKLEILSSIGMSGPLIGKFLFDQCHYLSTSFENEIVPSINYLKKLVHTNSNVVKVLLRDRWRFNDPEGKVGPNIALLRNRGVPECIILKFILVSPGSLFVQTNKFNEAVLELKKIGVNLSDNVFLHCLHVRLWMKKSTWDSKLAAYKSLGWSEDEVLSMFKSQPQTMGMSLKKMELGINFLTNNLNWTRSYIARYPIVLMLSLEKRLIPRTYVLQTLQSKGLINGISIGVALTIAEDVFLKKFVIKYHYEFPNLLSEYQSKMGTQSSLVGSASKCAIEKM